MLSLRTQSNGAPRATWQSIFFSCLPLSSNIKSKDLSSYPTFTASLLGFHLHALRKPKLSASLTVFAHLSPLCVNNRVVVLLVKWQMIDMFIGLKIDVALYADSYCPLGFYQF